MRLSEAAATDHKIAHAAMIEARVMAVSFVRNRTID
jgi:hypothetical protein